MRFVQKPSAANKKSLSVYLSIIIVIIILIVFGRCVAADFLWYDDQVHIFNNPYFNPLTWHSLHVLLTHSYAQLYIPVSYAAFAAVCLVSRTPAHRFDDTIITYSPHVFHAVNLGLHTLNAVLVFWLLRRLVRSRWAAMAGALVFAIHPLQVESVAWISELRGLLCATFSLVSIHAYLAAIDQQRNVSEKDFNAIFLSGIGWKMVALVCFILSILCKPWSTVLPVAVAIIAAHYKPSVVSRKYIYIY